MKQFSALDLCKWIGTHKEIIESARISQVYRQDIMQVTFALHTKEGKRFLVITPPRNLFLTQSQPATEHKETGFGTFLRQHLKGAIIQKIEQIRSERILVCRLSKGNIFIELFNKGNIIITDTENNIVSILQKQIYKERELKKGELYETPISFDALHETKEAFLAHIDLHKDLESISLFLATRCGLGGKNAEKICEYASCSPLEKVTAIDPAIIFEAFKRLLSEKESFRYLEEEYFEQEKERLHKGVSKEIQKIQIILEQQKKTLSETEKEITKQSRYGEYIYENYMFFEELKDAYLKNTLTQEALINLKKKYDIKENIQYNKPNVTIVFEK